jgi:nitrogen-specific signal transduction histidine kinase/CheY-like chemotaxis protein
VRGEDCAVLYYEGSLQDVTERKGTEEQLRLAQRMEAVGRLAGGIAHDFNNLLTIIGGYGDLLRKAIGADGVLGSHVETMMAAADRAAALTRQLLAFSRRQVLEPRTVHLNAIVEEMEPLLRRLLAEDVEIVTEVAPTIGSVKVDPGQMEQVIMNLAVNARDAMPNGGRLVLATGEETLEDDGGNGRFHVEPGRYVLLTVTDTGEGMDAQVVERIFEPFFTTKEQDKGTGLGLSTVYGIVKQSGGYIYVFSRPGHGATFRIYLPRVEEEAAIQEARGPEASPGGGSETILVVEDEDGIRNLVRSVLALGGYHVLAAASAQEALDRAAEHRGRIDLLLTDVVMPGMGGRELVESLRPLRPDTRILYMSGYTADGELRRHLVETQAAFLQKPFTPDGLLAKAREVLGLPGSAPEILQRQPSSDSR